MADAKKDLDIPRLCTAIQRSRLMLRRYRQERREMVRQYVGQHWSDEGTRAKVPVNLVALYAGIVGRSLIAAAPRVLLTTFDQQQKSVVAAANKWVNEEIPRIRLANTLRRVVFDSLFSLGICKVALATPADAGMMAWRLKAGEPFAERVDLDDFVYDIHARDFDEVSYIGHRFRAPLEVIRESPMYGPARKQLAAQYDEAYNVEGDERISTLGRGVWAGNAEEYEDYVDLWEIYLPRHRLVLTLADDRVTGPAVAPGSLEDPLRAQHWLGPDEGPYHMLSLGIVPGNAMPKAPIQDLIDLHEFANQTYRKLMRQAERQKELTAVQGGATEDGQRTVDANDGDMVRVDNPTATQVVKYGGPDQALLGIFQQSRDLFSWMAGNLDMMGGLSPQSRTLGQDKLLAENASGQVADMQNRTVEYAAGVCRGLLWYWWHDPRRVMRTTREAPGSPEFGVTAGVSPQQRQRVPLEGMDLKVDPYSLQHQSPQQRFGAVQATLQALFLPLAQLAMQQGVSLDFQKLFEIAGRYLDLPELGDVLTFGETPTAPTEAGPPDVGSVKPAETTRNYTRTSQAGASRFGKDQGILNALGGGGSGAFSVNGNRG